MLVAYDISDPKALLKVRKAISSYAVSGQKSFYECWVKPWELRDLSERLRTLMNEETDRIHFFELSEKDFILFIGEVRRQSSEPFLVV